MIRYLATLPPGKIVLWCYLAWYLATLAWYFDPSPTLWINSLGLSAVIGMGLVLSVSNRAAGPLDPWQTLRLFLMPFCVSSFSSLTKTQGYLLIFPAERGAQLASVGACLGVLTLVAFAKWSASRR